MSGPGQATPRISRGFDRLAPIYDLCADLAFAGRIHESQVALLPRLPALGRGLVVGGGSGRFLEALLISRRVETAVSIDASSAMTNRTAKRLGTGGLAGRAELRVGGLERLHASERFDLIATHCFLDLFDDDDLRVVMASLDHALAPGGWWLFSDFSTAGSGPGGACRRIVVGVLYRFFNATCGLKTAHLPNFERAFADRRLSAEARSSHAGGLLRATLYRRSSDG